ncbi:DUF488 domain-containing protein [Litchfieldella xinjiangensis]|uniref:DUF488 domain-containing protein n=1 Tax=Litchfieldella xinjiangensis TaxID=1166948 RepID=UPI0005B79181|nr:DUF488 domain-containing protein [Halomonas xinjiangensis]
MKTPSDIQCKRAYDTPEKSDGYRVLVDGIWPRGRRKEALELDEWRKELAPSKKLRQWFKHDPQRWDTFRQRYHKELDKQKRAIDDMLKACDGHKLTLVFGAKETEYNNAVALKEYLEKRT